MIRPCPFTCGGGYRDDDGTSFHMPGCQGVAPVSRTAPTEPPPATVVERCKDCGGHPVNGFLLHYATCPRAGAVSLSSRKAAESAPHVHAFRGARGGIACSGCDASLSGLTLAALGFRHESETWSHYDSTRNAMADEAGRLRDQLRDLESENSRLRRDVERLTRKAGGR